jgi:two-component system CheB/CheR fusion protein
MPRLDGFGLVRRLRDDPQYRRILVVAVTGLNRPVDLAATRRAGFDGHIIKPMTEEVVARLLDRARDARSGEAET